MGTAEGLSNFSTYGNHMGRRLTQGLLSTVEFMSERLLDEPNSCICSNVSDRVELLVWESTL